jgi:hypothetical protein
MNETFDWRRSDRRLFLVVAVLFAIAVLIGFARTYYLKFAFDAPPLPGLLVHIHGLMMTLWVGFFIGQVWLIRTKNHRVHMNMGMLGIALAIAISVIGFFTAVASAKYGSTSMPPDVPPLVFMVVPFFDLLMFVILFGGAIYFRTRPAEHKRLMLLTVINFLPPAIARFPFEPFISGGIPVFFGVPAAITILLLAYDTWRNRKLNTVFLVGALLLIASYPVRILLSGTEAWTAFATWLTTWAA